LENFGNQLARGPLAARGAMWNDQESLAALHAALDGGVNFF